MREIVPASLLMAPIDPPVSTLRVYTRCGTSSMGWIGPVARWPGGPVVWVARGGPELPGR
ncbi:hypothetical protein [Kineosporia sp. NBRC 101731]|uniref:hypothetical protein n=1 Tax=Kineosporia sp. NBRC 101731 TaxID=3032199 RepID=UPI0025575AAF|nr:hypothetical protein [Kineosporia sp. NBRC 101731]